MSLEASLELKVGKWKNRHMWYSASQEATVESMQHLRTEINKKCRNKTAHFSSNDSKLIISVLMNIFGKPFSGNAMLQNT